MADSRDMTFIKQRAWPHQPLHTGENRGSNWITSKPFSVLSDL